MIMNVSTHYSLKHINGESERETIKQKEIKEIFDRNINCKVKKDFRLTKNRNSAMNKFLKKLEYKKDFTNKSITYRGRYNKMKFPDRNETSNNEPLNTKYESRWYNSYPSLRIHNEIESYMIRLHIDRNYPQILKTLYWKHNLQINFENFLKDFFKGSSHLNLVDEFSYNLNDFVSVCKTKRDLASLFMILYGHRFDTYIVDKLIAKW